MHTTYDDLNRPVLVIEGYDASKLAEPLNPGLFDTLVSWQTTAGIRWLSPNFTSTADSSNNKATATVYDTAGRVSAVVGINRRLDTSTNPPAWTTQPQFTKYVYGTANGSPNSAMDSLVDSNDLLAVVQYPNPTDGLPGTLQADTVSYAYNRLGEVRGTRDQNNTIHAYNRDRAGRQIADQITQFGSSVADQTITSIESAFDASGRLSRVRSRAGSTVKNAVGFSYTPLWQIATVRQDVDGELDGGGIPTRAVGYTYDPQSPATGNHARLISLEYPDGADLEFTYSTSGSINSSISRIQSLKLDVDPAVAGPDIIADYSRLGLSTTAVLDLTEIDVQLDRTIGSDGKRRAHGFIDQAIGRYPGLDPYSRLKAQRWVVGETTTSGSVPTHLWLAGDSYKYDASSKIIEKTNLTPLEGVNTDWQYSFDQADRLNTALRGESGTAFTPAAVGSLQWSLDSLGNWHQIATDRDGDGVFGGVNDTTESRAFNASNERADAGTPTPYIYDDNGNLTSAVMFSGTLTRKYLYDAWNRLTEVRHVDAENQVFSIAKYRYNGLHWRTEKIADIRNPQTYPAQLTQRREMYYSSDWQLLEERIDDDYSESEPGSSTIDRIAQQVWGLRGLDDAILRREDRATPEIPDDPGTTENEFVAAQPPDGTHESTWYYLTDHQGSVLGLIGDVVLPDASADRKVVNRVSYDPYGNSLFHALADITRDGVADSNDLFGYLDLWFVQNTLSGPLSADHNYSGTVDSVDLFAYLDDWFATSGETPGKNWVSRPFQTSRNDFAADSAVGYCGYLLNFETGDYCVRHRVYDTTQGRWLQRDPIGYAGGPNLYAYVMSAPITARDPMGLHPEIDDALAYQRQYQESVLADARAGRISGDDAARLIRLAGDTAQLRIDLAARISSRRDVRLNAGLKAGANASIDTIAGLVTLGSYTDVGLFSVDNYERGAGYGTAYAVSRISQEIGSIVVTAGLAKAPGSIGKIAFGMDMAGNLAGSARGGYDIYKNGLSWRNAAESVGGAIGFAGGIRTLSGLCRNLSKTSKAAESADIVGTTHRTVRPTQEHVYLERVEEYERQLRNGEQVDPIWVGRSSDGHLHILDGHHRYVASQRAGKPVQMIVQPDPLWSYSDWSDVRYIR